MGAGYVNPRFDFIEKFSDVLWLKNPGEPDSPCFLTDRYF